MARNTVHTRPSQLIRILVLTSLLGCLFAEEPVPKAGVSTNLFLVEIYDENLPDLLHGEKPGDVSALLRDLGLSGHTTAGWNGTNRMNLSGTRMDIRRLKNLLGGKAAVMVRNTIHRVAFPAKDLRPLLTQPDAFTAEMLKRFEAGQGEVRSADTLLGLSGEKVTLGVFAVNCTVAPDQKRINVTLKREDDPSADMRFLAESGVNQLLRHRLDGEQIECLIYTGIVVNPWQAAEGGAEK